MTANAIENQNQNQAEDVLQTLVDRDVARYIDTDGDEAATARLKAQIRKRMETILSRPWCVLEPCDKANGFAVYDFSIHTDTGIKVVGEDEWGEEGRAVLQHIVALHNAALRQTALTAEAGFVCENCGSEFEEPMASYGDRSDCSYGEIDRCPDCGSDNIRAAVA